ncbi:hypothetical protein F8M41_007978 [Gigaspora margarita]|uniref:Uncharacterized protein n=1 Tax=Gigaspora margarita TaxID=4874 RepID=A0A8H4EQX2_GIGMA|nr:hypothetical protein F8M41_007978 [Gigaspora margarita]
MQTYALLDNYCGGCHGNHPKEQFIWNGKRHKTCKRCKERRDNKSKGNELDHQDNFEVLSGEGSAGSACSAVTNENFEPERSYAKVDYLDLEDLIEHEIQKLTTDAQIDGVADVVYQNHLTVNLDNTMFQDRTAKEIANLVVAEIEGAQSESYKDSNRKRRMRYDCGGKISIQIDLVLNAIEVDIYHGSLHTRPELCIEMPAKLQEEIKTHSHLTVVELRNYLRH